MQKKDWYITSTYFLASIKLVKHYTFQHILKNNNVMNINNTCDIFGSEIQTSILTLQEKCVNSD